MFDPSLLEWQMRPASDIIASITSSVVNGLEFASPFSLNSCTSFADSASAASCLKPVLKVNYRDWVEIEYAIFCPAES